MEHLTQGNVTSNGIVMVSLLVCLFPSGGDGDMWSPLRAVESYRLYKYRGPAITLVTKKKL